MEEEGLMKPHTNRKYSIRSYWGGQERYAMVEAPGDTQAIRFMAADQGIDLRKWKIVKTTEGKPMTYRVQEHGRGPARFFRAVRKN